VRRSLDRSGRAARSRPAGSGRPHRTAQPGGLRGHHAGRRAGPGGVQGEVRPAPLPHPRRQAVTDPSLPAAPRATVRADGIHVSFGRTRALDGISLGLSPGVSGLLGPNGAGKTTLLRLLATVPARDAGRLELLGRDPASATQRLAIRQRLGYMPQEPGFHRAFSAFEFVDYVAILKEMTNRRERHAEVRRGRELGG